MAKVLMVQGTMSNAGKSLIVAGLCRILKQDGYKVAPFKSQNMALNSYITEEGLEMGRAQVMQAEAAQITPNVDMNPILLKPTNDVGSQVIVNGKSIGNMKAMDYFKYKKKLIPEIREAFERLEKEVDVIVIEGAGSPAEINLKENDIVNMGLAEMIDAPVLLVGDIDRGGVFAQLIGTLVLLEDEERERIKGLIVNKFRGDVNILKPGIEMLEDKGKKEVVGVVPYMNISIEDEDSLTTKFENQTVKRIDIVVIRYPRISNFTDFDVFANYKDVSVRYVTKVEEFGKPDLIFLPGSKNTMGDLKWLRETGLEAMIKKQQNVPIFGICGGYQMLGLEISDPYKVESGGVMHGMGLLPVKTVLHSTKITTQVQGYFSDILGDFKDLSGKEFKGYEIHMGDTMCVDDNTKHNHMTSFEVLSTKPFENKFEDRKKKLCDVHMNDSMEARLAKKMIESEKCRNKINGFDVRTVKDIHDDGFFAQKSNFSFINKANENDSYIYGSYVHGLFDYGDISSIIVKKLAEKNGIKLSEDLEYDYAEFKEEQYNILADNMRKYMDMERIYKILDESVSRKSNWENGGQDD